jgi:hypothetical protein
MRGGFTIPYSRYVFKVGIILHSRFNSGKFGVPWEDTEAILEELEVEMVVYNPAVQK